VPVPKRRKSKARTSMRRSQWKLLLPSVALCPQCQHPKLSYVACPSCGYYRGRKVMKSEEEKKKKEEKK